MANDVAIAHTATDPAFHWLDQMSPSARSAWEEINQSPLVTAARPSLGGGGAIDVPQPLSFLDVAPTGSLIRHATATSTFTETDVADSYLAQLEIGATVSIAIIPSATLKPSLHWSNSQGNVLAEVVAQSNGETIWLRSIPVIVAGEFHVDVSAENNSQGAYTLEVYLNADFEMETLGGTENNSLATAQDISSTNKSLSDGLMGHLAVVGTRGRDREDNFETGRLNDEWNTFSSQPGGVVEVRDAFGGFDGEHALVMGRNEGGFVPTLNEATWTVDLTAVTSATLSYRHADLGDELHPLPASFTDHANGDGVSISVDGLAWFRIADAVNLPTGEWQLVTVDLMQASIDAGITLNGLIHIRFQQYDDSEFGVDGRAYDSIQIIASPELQLDDWYHIILEDGQSATWAAQRLIDTHALRLELYDAAGQLLAAAQQATNVSQIIQNYLDTTTNGVPDDYFLRVIQPSEEYVVLVTLGGSFDFETNSTAAQAQALGPAGQAIGYVSDQKSAALDVLRTIQGPVFTGYIPPDPVLAVGPRQIIAMVNTTLVIHDKASGSVVFEQDMSSANGFFGSVGATSTVFDPWVVYDQESRRFFIVGIDIESNERSNVYLAVSTTSTPTSGTSWHKYKLDFTHYAETAGLGSGAHFPDYEKISVTRDALYVSGNYFPITTGAGVYAGITAFDKASLLVGNPATKLYDAHFPGFSVFPLQPNQTTTQAYFAEAVGTSTIRMHTIINVGTAPQRITADLTVPAFSAPVAVPQLGGLRPIDAVDSRIMGGVWNSGSAWFTHPVVDPNTHTGENVARWYEVSTNNFPAGTPTLRQSGNVDPGPGEHAWMPNIAVDRFNNMAIAFSVGGASQHPSAGFTGRFPTDPLGVTAPVTKYAIGQEQYQLTDGSGRNRWGDYSGLAVDPSDGTTFWAFNEYVTEAKLWGTQLAAFQMSPTPESDYYKFTAQAGDVLEIRTTTPFGDDGEIVNQLDPSIELYGPDFSLMAIDFDSNPDRRNAVIHRTVEMTGTYRVKVISQHNQGVYLLTVNGATGIDPAPSIIDLTPDQGAHVRQFPSVYRIQISEPIAAQSVHPDDLTVNGIPAIAVTLDGDTLTFTLDPLTNIGDGNYVVRLGDNSIADLQGQRLISGLTANFTVDREGPRITQTLWNDLALPSNHVLSPGSLTFQANLSEDIFNLASARRGPLSPGADDIVLRDLTTGTIIDESAIRYDDTTDTFRANYRQLREGNYELKLISGPGAFQDRAGNDLDGEPLGSATDGTVTGDGTPGGNYTISFVVDATVQDAQPFARVVPLSSLISQSLDNSGFINQSGDIDEFRFFAHAGERLESHLSLTSSVIATMTIMGPAGTVASATTGTPGGESWIAPVLLPTDGFYNVRISANGTTNYRVDLLKNATSEARLGRDSNGSSLPVDDSLIAIAGGHWAVLGETARKFAYAQTNSPAQFIDISATGKRIDIVDDDDEIQVETTVGNVVLPAGVILVGNNGGVLAGLDVNLYFVNLPLPAPNLGRGIFPYWDDLGLPEGGVFTEERLVDGVRTLIIQWQEMPHFFDDPSPAGQTITFQMQLFETGNSIAKFVYRDAEFGDPLYDFGASSTIGFQESDEVGYEFNFGARELSDLFPGSRPVHNGDVVDLYFDEDIDSYSIDLRGRSGHKIDVTLTGIDGADFSHEILELLDQNGNVVATAPARAPADRSTSFDLSIVDLVVPNIRDNQYTIRVRSRTAAKYSIVVTDHTTLDWEPNDQSTDMVVIVDDESPVVGYLSSIGDVDRFELSGAAGETVAVQAKPLWSGPFANPSNTLDAELRILSRNSNIVRVIDLGSLDGTNPQILWTFASDDIVTVEIRSQAGSGEYQMDFMRGGTDYGDAPAPFRTRLADDGARHRVGGPVLGSSVDADLDGNPSALADGDDTLANDDEEGVAVKAIARGQNEVVWQINVSNVATTAFVDAWLDFDGDDRWGTTERIATHWPVSSGNNQLRFIVPDTATLGPRIARFRISSQGVDTPTGPAFDGEVEDYVVNVVQLAHLKIDDVRKSEGDNGSTNFDFTVTRSHADSEVRVHVETESIDAISGVDFDALSSDLIFPANGPLTQTVRVTVHGDGAFEADELFRVVLSAPEGATLDDATGLGTIVNDDRSATIRSVRVASSNWSNAFLQHVDSQLQLGYPIPNGANQLQPLPWAQLDRVYLEFSSDVGNSLSDQLVQLHGLRVDTYATLPLQYDSQRFIVRIDLKQPMIADRLTISVDDAITDNLGNSLDGEWIDGQLSSQSGNGTPGGDFQFGMQILPGDVNGDALVSAQDYALVRDRLDRATNDVAFDSRRDIDGDGLTLLSDLLQVRNRVGLNLPVPPVPARAIDALFADHSEHDKLIALDESSD